MVKGAKSEKRLDNERNDTSDQVTEHPLEQHDLAQDFLERASSLR